MLVILLRVTRVVIRMIRIIGITRKDPEAWSEARGPLACSLTTVLHDTIYHSLF